MPSPPIDGPREQKETKLQRAHAALLQLARSRSFLGENLIADFRAITELAGQALSVARTSVWLYDHAKGKIRCLDLYDLRTGMHTDGEELLFKDHPSYFLALEANRIVVADEARTNPHTAEFGQHYLGQHGITSMLDAAARLRGELVGIICLEHIGPPRHWSTEEEVFACAFADLVSLALEASERVWAESALAASETRFREIIQNATDCILLLEVGQGGRFRCELVNPAALAVSGFREEELIGKTPQDVLPAHNAAHLQQMLEECVATQRPVSAEREVLMPSGRRWLHYTVAPIRHERGHVYRLALIGHDVTGQRRLEHELSQAKKLEALGTLAGGIAHDMNNLLASLVGHLDLLEMELPAEAKRAGQAADRLHDIRRTLERGRNLVRQILLFGRRQPPQRQRLLLEELVADCVRMLSATVPPNVHLSFATPEDVLPSVWADPTQLHQVVTNLITNAVHAVEARGAGSVTVSIQPAPPDAGPGLLLLVHDTGVGMSPDVQERMFEPFFTTKPPGRGNGLGLAVVHSIVQAHGGNIQVRSTPNHGTRVRVFLPTGVGTDVRPPPQANALLSHAAPGSLVLFVDDEELLRAMGHSYLARLGFTPLTAADLNQAERLLADASAPLTALVTDQVMPGGTGIELIDRLRRRQPRLPAVLMTGLAAGLVEELAHRGDVVVLEKPFRLDELAQALARAQAALAETPA